MQTLESFFLVKTAVKFRNLQISKILNTDTNRFSQFFSRLCTYLWDIHSLKNKPALSIFGYSYGVNQKVSLTSTLIFSKLKVLLWTIKRRNNNPLLSKSTLKYLAYLPSISGWSTASTRPMHIYLGVAVLLLHFQ